KKNWISRAGAFRRSRHGRSAGGTVGRGGSGGQPARRMRYFSGLPETRKRAACLGGGGAGGGARPQIRQASARGQPESAEVQAPGVTAARASGDWAGGD